MQPTQTSDSTSENKQPGSAEKGIRIVNWHNWEAIAREEREAERRRLVHEIFSDKVMGGLALLLIPVLLILDFASLSPDAFLVLSIIDVAIWIFFILEYICRFFVAENKVQYVLSPFGLFDLIIIAAPAIALAFGAGYRIAGYLRILRVAQVFQVIKLGGKTVRERISQRPPAIDAGPGTHVVIYTIPLARPPGDTPHTWTMISLTSQTPTGIQKGQWTDFSGWASSDLGVLSTLSGLPRYLLQERLWERTYPRGEVAGDRVSIFLKIPLISEDHEDSRKWQVTWDGLLVIYDKEGVMTFSQSRIPILEKVPALVGNEGIRLSGPSIVYVVVRESLRTVEGIFSNAEDQVSNLEALPINRLPSNFTNMMYTDQKVLDRIQSWLHHTKSALDEIASGDVEARAPDTERLHSAVNRCSSALDTAETISDSFSRMVDFYLNMTSLSMNQVMKYLAVLTALTLIPALIGGLLGMNLAGNPWPVTLLPVVTIVALFMLLTAWIYLNLGWLKK